MKLLVSLVLLFCVTSPAFAKAPVPEWTVDRSKSSIQFRGFDINGNPFTSTFQSWGAEIHFDPENLAGSRALFTIDTRSATTGDKTFTDYLIAPDWYDPEVAPLATFQIQSFSQRGENLYDAKGILHLSNHKKTNVLPVPGVSLPFKATFKKTKGKSDQAEFTSNFSFAIPDYSPVKKASPSKRNFRKISFHMKLKAHSGK
jgi:polyisoprenoid-binding protein YceI